MARYGNAIAIAIACSVRLRLVEIRRCSGLSIRMTLSG